MTEIFSRTLKNKNVQVNKPYPSIQKEGQNILKETIIIITAQCIITVKSCLQCSETK